MDKIKIIFFGLIFLIVFSTFIAELFLRTQWNVGILDVLSALPLPDSEIEESVGKFGRKYPNFIKGLWEPSPLHFNKAINDAGLKGLGVNTVSVSVEYIFDEQGNYRITDPGEELMVSNLIKAKKEGFTVLVAPNFGGPSARPEQMPITLEEFLEISKEVAIKWAKISEAYGVEFFAPQNEFDVAVSRFTDSVGERFNLTSQWHLEILPELRKVFKGKLMVKLADPHENLNFSGYDLIGITARHDEVPLEEFREYIKNKYDDLVSSANVSNTDWLVSEAWFPYGGPFYSVTTNRNGESLDELQDDYFQISIEELKKFEKNKPVGFIFIAWSMPGMDIENRPAEQVLHDFFTSIN